MGPDKVRRISLRTFGKEEIGESSVLAKWRTNDDTLSVSVSRASARILGIEDPEKEFFVTNKNAKIQSEPLKMGFHNQKKKERRDFGKERATDVLSDNCAICFRAKVEADLGMLSTPDQQIYIYIVRERERASERRKHTSLCMQTISQVYIFIHVHILFVREEYTYFSIIHTIC